MQRKLSPNRRLAALGGSLAALSSSTLLLIERPHRAGNTVHFVVGLISGLMLTLLIGGWFTWVKKRRH